VIDLVHAVANADQLDEIVEAVDKAARIFVGRDPGHGPIGAWSASGRASTRGDHVAPRDREGQPRRGSEGCPSVQSLKSWN
jgi:hypothetical protein